MRSLFRICVPVVFSLVLILVAGVTLLGRTQIRAHAAGTTIALYNNFGRPYSSFTVSGNGFGQNEAVTITFDATVIGNATAVQTKFSQKVNVPGSATPGNHTVTATGQTTGSTASAIFLVQTWWVMFGFDAQNTHFNPDENVVNSTNVSQLTGKWTYPTKSNPSTPIVRKDNVYFAAHSGTVTVLRTAGNVMWSKTIPTTISSIAPAVYYGIVYVASQDGNLYAISKTGSCLWKFPTGGSITSSPAVANGLVYVGSSNHTLYAINASNGQLAWSHATNGIITSSPAVDKTNVYIGSQDNSLYALSAKT